MATRVDHTTVRFSDARFGKMSGRLPWRDPVPTSAESFDLIVSQADREFMESQERRQPETPFWHYTTPLGLEGILGSGHIWATEYGRLNDTEELTRGEPAIQSALDAMIDEYGDNTAISHICRMVDEGRRDTRIVDMKDINVYVTSFSTHGDLLGQWREYAARSTGYAIGFNTIPLPTSAEAAANLHSALGVDFGPCIYDEDEYRARVRSTLTRIAHGLEKYIDTYCRTDAQIRRINHSALVCALSKLGALVPFLKGAAFAEEKEWRLMHIGTPPQKLIKATPYPPPHDTAAYIEVSLKKPDLMDLHQVIVGPKAPGLDFARSALDRFGYGHIGVAKSTVPVR